MHGPVTAIERARVKWSDTEKCPLFSLTLRVIIQIEAHLSDPGPVSMHWRSAQIAPITQRIWAISPMCIVDDSFFWRPLKYLNDLDEAVCTSMG